ncbi:nucleotidyltransferase [Mesomycoplasma moatsii]|uniref:nucleotidyltransferase n=1 Tax=Mesomycoplasma moatsii TaxID=171287 RepID=UPI0003B3881C
MDQKIRIGIVAEYNPFHNGHIYQINEVKKRWPNSSIVVVMPGKFVQRGELSIASFEERKKIALENGVDEVYELPFLFATQAAHIFAQGAVLELNKHNINILVFGSETNNIDDFFLVAKTIKNNENSYYELIKKEMKKGTSFPKANQIVLEKIIDKSFTMPNDILGLEYVKTIINFNLNIEAYSIKRNIGFHSDKVFKNIASATHIRKLIFDQDNSYQKYTPMRFDKLPDRIENYYSIFQEIVINSPKEKLKSIKLMSEGMENLFKKNINAKTYDEFVRLTNSKRYTSSRIKRVMLYVLLGIKDIDNN